MEFLTQFYEIIYAIFLAIYCMIVPGSTKNEGFIGLPGLRTKDLSLYPNKENVGSRGGDDRYGMFEPYLRQTELHSREQRDNHRWPTSRTLAGSPEQSLSSAPVLPCSYPRPKLGGDVLHSKEDAIMRNKLTHSPIDF
jgi:hypothetical protein